MTSATPALASLEKAPSPAAAAADSTEPKLQDRHEQWRRWAKRLATFFAGQGALQVLNLLNGFLLIRCLSVKDYAIFSLVTGFQGAVTILVDVGLGSSIVALLAGRTDKHVIGGHIRSTRRYRDRIFLVLLPLIGVAFSLLSSQQGLGWPSTALFLAAILVTLYFESWTAFYSVPLMVHQEIGLFYRIPSVLTAIRLILNLSLYALSALSSWTAVWLGSIAVFFQGWLYKRQSAHYIAEPAASDPAINRQVLDYIRPLVPSTVFFALQGQIGIFLISWFGDAHGMAEVGALGRLAQLFVMLGAFNTVIIAPNIARIPRTLLPRRYFQVFAGACAVCLALLGASAFAPEALLWVLGQHYLHLHNELIWMTGSACLSYLTGVLWTMHSARQWIFTWGVWSYILVVLVAQILGVTFLDLSTTRNVLVLSTLGSLAALLVQLVWGFVGFSQEGRPSGATPQKTV